MNTSAMHSVHLPLLDAMIARAELACERYRRYAEEPGIERETARVRLNRWRMMERSLSRLRTQRAPAPAMACPGDE